MDVRYMRETKGESLEEIEDLWQSEYYILISVG